MLNNCRYAYKFVYAVNDLAFWGLNPWSAFSPNSIDGASVIIKTQLQLPKPKHRVFKLLNLKGDTQDTNWYMYLNTINDN